FAAAFYPQSSQIPVPCIEELAKDPIPTIFSGFLELLHLISVWDFRNRKLGRLINDAHGLPSVSVSNTLWQEAASNTTEAPLYTLTLATFASPGGNVAQRALLFSCCSVTFGPL